MLEKHLEHGRMLLKIIDAETDACERRRLLEIAQKTLRRIGDTDGIAKDISEGISARKASACSDETLEQATDTADRQRTFQRDREAAAAGHPAANVPPPSHFCLRHG